MPETHDLEAGGKASQYRQLHPAKIDRTVCRLHRRIAERFPDSDLAEVAAELEALVRDTEQRCRWIRRPIRSLRWAIGLLLLIGLASLVLSIVAMRPEVRSSDWSDLAQGVEATTQEVVLVGVAVLFLLSLETRIKRSKAAKGLHQLRAIAHVIDMHQLTKDPGRLLPEASSTASSPASHLSSYELMRYLDYCSEMLSLIGKTAALYPQYCEDSQVLDAVEDIESLTGALSQKIWQKIQVAELYRDRLQERAEGSSP